MRLRSKTGGCCDVKECPEGLILKNGEIYLLRRKENKNGELTIKVFRCSDGQPVVFWDHSGTCTVEPVEQAE